MRVSRATNGTERRGIVLFAVILVVAVLSLAAYRFSDLMMAEVQAVDSYGRAVQAREAAAAGVDYVRGFLSTFDPATSGNPYDNAGLFQAVTLGADDNPRMRIRFSVLGLPDVDDADSTSFRYGLTDECGKININALYKLDSSGQIAHDVLVKIPGLDEEKVNALLDWIDEDEQPRQEGAENEYYGALQPTYKCKNGPLDSLEELLYVKGFTSQLVFGNDRNRNGVLDPGEDDGSGVLDRGLSAYLTVFSRELNVDATNQPKIYINDQDTEGLYNKLVTAVGEEVATFVLAARQYGLTAASGSGGVTVSVTQSAQGQLSIATVRGTGGQGGARASGGQRIASIYQLVNGTVSIPSQQQGGQPTVYKSPLSDTSSIEQYLPLLLDKTTTSRNPELPARVNVLTAPRAVLAALPNMDDAVVESVVGIRPPLTSADLLDPVYQSPTWMLTKANVPATTMQSLERYITSRSQVYRIQVVGHYEGGGPTSRVEAIIDTNAGRPRVVYFRDLTELGRGFNLTGQ